MSEKWMPDEESILNSAKRCVELVSIGELDAAGDIRALISAAVEKALAEPRPEVQPNQRLYDLVRYQRHGLHDAGLLTDDEFASLVLSGSSSARRLEDYDGVRRQLAEQSVRQHQREVLSARIEELQYARENQLFGTIEWIIDRQKYLRAELAALESDK